jgi:hypothetical protein
MTDDEALNMPLISICQAIRAIQPGYDPPLKLAGLGANLRRSWEECAKLLPDPKTRGLPPPPEGYLLVDGFRTDEAPLARPFVLQWIRDDDLSGCAQYVDLGEPFSPCYPLAPTGPSRSRKIARSTLLGAGAAAIVGGFVWYGAARGAWVRESPGLVAADQAAYLDALKPHCYVSMGLIGVGTAAMGVGGGLWLVDVRHQQVLTVSARF